MNRATWLRVSRSQRCPVCGRGDWCLVARDGTAAICARIESRKRCGDAGYLHRLRDDEFRPERRRVSLPLPTEPVRDFAALADQYRAAVNHDDLRRLASRLGVAAVALADLGIGWDGAAWTFPMRSSAGRIVGIRRRFDDGRKLSVKGGREGLFVPAPALLTDPLLICEGPTDTAAMLTLGLSAIGRPSCRGGVRECMALAPGHDLVIVADHDQPGDQGARFLALALTPYASGVRIIRPPDEIKDARAWVQAGATRDDVLAAIDAAEPVRLFVRTALH